MGTRARTLLDELARLRPDLTDPEDAIMSGRVLVGGRIVTNPRSLVRSGTSVAVRASTGLRGSAKLQAALQRFGIEVEGRVALDVGAAAGGFTQVLLDAGARRVYAVDVGHGQLRGSLRQDARVVDLEATNVAVLDTELIPDRVDVLTMDVSYLALASAVAQVATLDLSPSADLVGLVKPMFELRLASAPTDDGSLQQAISNAVRGIEASGWIVVDTMRSPVTGAKGAVEGFVHATRG